MFFSLAGGRYQRSPISLSWIRGATLKCGGREREKGREEGLEENTF